MEKTLKVFLIVGITCGVLIGMMTEQIIAVVILAAVMFIISAILGTLATNARNAYPAKKGKFALYVLIFVLTILAAAALVFVLSDGYMSLENIKDMILPPPDASESFGNYEGWGAGYNPLTGKSYN